MARISTDERDAFILSRGEMGFCGVHERDMPFLRDFARQRERHPFWAQRDVLQRQRHLFRLVEDWLETLPDERREKITAPIAYAKDQWQRAARKLSQSGARHLQQSPDAMETGATPTINDGEGEDDHAGPPRRRADKRDTDGEEKWDPKWGDPNTELPPPLPQGMTRLPEPRDPQQQPKRGPKR